MKKYIKTLIIIFLFSLVVLLNGCNEEEKIEMNIEIKTKEDNTTYKLYNGNAEEFFMDKNGIKKVVKARINKEDGYLKVVIHNCDEPSIVVYEGTDFPSDFFTVTVTIEGNYRIYITCVDFIGDYSFEYDTN